MRACNALWTHKALGRRGNYIAAVGVFLCAGYLILAADAGPYPYVLLGLVALMLSLSFLRDYLWRRAFRSSGKYDAPLSTTLSEDEISVTFQGTQTSMPWSTFTSYLRTDEFLLLIIDQRRFSILPLADFSSPDDADACTDLANRHLPLLRKRWI